MQRTVMDTVYKHRSLIHITKQLWIWNAHRICCHYTSPMIVLCSTHDGIYSLGYSSMDAHTQFMSTWKRIHSVLHNRFVAILDGWINKYGSIYDVVSSYSHFSVPLCAHPIIQECFRICILRCTTREVRFDGDFTANASGWAQLDRSLRIWTVVHIIRVLFYVNYRLVLLRPQSWVSSAQRVRNQAFRFR